MRAILTVGLPGCGKSTYAAGLGGGMVELNLDALRALVAGDATDQAATPRAVGLRHRLMNHHAALRDDLIFSDTHARRKHRRSLIRALHRLGYEVELVFFNVGVATCLRRNAGRERVVPAAVIHMMAEQIAAAPPRPQEADGFTELTDPDDPLISWQAGYTAGGPIPEHEETFMGLIQSLMEKLQPAGTKEENKKQYFEVLVEALEDGVLTNDEIEELDALRKQLRLSQEDVAGMKLRAFQAAVNAAAADGVVTPKEEKDLEKIKAYLGIQESEIGRNKGTLNKMRMLYEIQKGNLPILEIAGLALEFGEVANLEEPAKLFEDPGGVVRPNATLSFKAGQPYRMGAGRPQPLPEGLEQVAGGTLVITNQRALFNTGIRGKNFGMKYDRLAQVLFFTDGFGFVPDNAAPRYLRVENKQEMELIAGIISRCLNPPPAQPEKPAGPRRPVK